MSDDLITEMSTRLGRTAPEVEKAFVAFASAVQDRIQSEGEVNLAGLGMISRKPGGTHFEPSDALSQAVNYRWLGAGAPIASASGRPASKLSVVPPAEVDESVLLETPAGLDTSPESESDASTPITVDLSPELLEEPPMPDDQKPIRKVSWAPIDEVDPTDLAGTAAGSVQSGPSSTRPKAMPPPPDPTPQPKPQPAATPAPPPAPGTRPAPAAKAPSTGPDQVAATPSPRPPAPPATPAPTPPAPPAEAFMPPAAGTGSPPPTSPGGPADALVEDLTYESLHQNPVASGGTAVGGAAAAVGAASGRPPQAGSRRAPSSRRAGSGEAPNRKPLLMVIGLLAIVAVGWFLINQFGGSSESTDPAVAQTENAEENPATAAGDPAADPAGTSGSAEATSGTPTSQPAAPAVTPPATSIDPNSSGYTLIVGSSLSRSGAETEMNRFRNLGHPVALLSYPDGDGQTRHRIAVGEFDSADAADSARRAMASRLPNGTWVRRIRR